MNILKVGIIQLDVHINNYNRNIERAMQMVEACVVEGCQLVCLPEAFSTSIDLRGIDQISEEIPGKTSGLLCQKAREMKIYIVAGIIEKDESKAYSSAVLIDSTGRIVGVYRRVHIYQLEKRFLAAGNSFKVFETLIGRIGIIIGYDINFPESCRYLFRQRVEIIVCPAHIPNSFASTTTHLAVARAIENSCYFILASSIGENIFARIKYMGNSMIARSPIALDPFSMEYVEEKEIIAKANRNETVIYGKVDLKRLRREQEENSHYKDAVLTSCFERRNSIEKS